MVQNRPKDLQSVSKEKLHLALSSSKYIWKVSTHRWCRTQGGYDDWTSGTLDSPYTGVDLSLIDLAWKLLAGTNPEKCSPIVAISFYPKFGALPFPHALGDATSHRLWLNEA